MTEGGRLLCVASRGEGLRFAGDVDWVSTYASRAASQPSSGTWLYGKLKSDSHCRSHAPFGGSHWAVYATKAEAMVT